MSLSRFRPLAALGGASLFVLSACGPSIAPYEPPPPQTDSQALAAAPAPDEAAAGAALPDAAGAPAGEVHAHGGGELSVTREDDFLTVTLDAPLSNFGLDEDAVPREKKAEKFASGIAEPLGPTECEETERSVTGRSDGTHGALTVSVVWRCRQIERVEGIRIHVFDLYPGFEHLDAIYLGPDGRQVAKELTPADNEIDFD